MQPKGSAGAKAWLLGAQYTFGPATVGTSIFNFQSQGSPAPAGISQRSETGFAVGGNYVLAPGLVLYRRYLYGTRHQGDFNFATGTPGSANNNTRAQEVNVGTVVK